MKIMKRVKLKDSTPITLSSTTSLDQKGLGLPKKSRKKLKQLTKLLVLGELDKII